MTWSVTMAVYHTQEQIQSTISTKNEGPSENMGFNEKILKISEQKRSDIPVLAWRTKQWKHKTPRATTELDSCKQEEINCSKIEKSIQFQTVRTLQD